MKFLRMIMVMITVSGVAFSQEKDEEAKLEELKKTLDDLYGPQIEISNRRFAALDSIKLGKKEPEKSRPSKDGRETEFMPK